jgi:hypothetical protein
MAELRRNSVAAEAVSRFGGRLYSQAAGVASELQQQEDQPADAHRKKSDDGAVEEAKMGLRGMVGGNNEGFTYSPLFRLTLNVSVLMPPVEHAAGHV